MCATDHVTEDNGNFGVTVLQVGSLRSRCPQSGPPLKHLGENPSPLSSILVDSQCPLASSCEYLPLTQKAPRGMASNIYHQHSGAEAQKFMVILG